MALRTAAFVGLIALVAGLGWWLLSEPDDDADLGRSLSAAMGRSSAGSGDAEAGRDVDTEADQESGIDTRSFRERDPRAPAPDALTILFESETHMPQAGVNVELFVLAQQTVIWYGGQQQAAEPPWQTLRTNADGEIVLRQLPPAGLNIVGRGGGLLGHKRLGVERVAPGERVVVTMKPIRKVAVRVIDQAGQPVAGAPVTARNGNQAGPGYHWTTNPNGIAAFEITPLHGNAYTAKEFHAQVQLPTGTVRSKGVPWVDGDVTEVDVEVKRGVFVRLKVVDAEGEPAVGKKSIRWESGSSGSRSLSYSDGIVLSSGLWDLSSGRQHGSNQKKRTFDGSETLLAGFKPGSKIRLILEEEGRCAVEEKLDLPPGEGITDVVMRQGAPAPVIEIPLVHEGGLPVTEGKFRLTAKAPQAGGNLNLRGFRHLAFEGGGSYLSVGGGPGGVVRTPNRDGVVRLIVQPGKPVDLKVERARAGGEMFFWGGSNKKQKPLLETKVAALQPGELHRLEPLVIPPVPLVVAGHVVDANGAGVKGALVRLAPAAGHNDPWNSGTYHLMQLKVRTDDDGSFAIRGAGKIEGWRVYARLGDSGRSELVPFAAGASDVTLTLVPAGSLEGVLVSALPRKKAHIRLEPVGGSIHQNLKWVYPEMDFNASCDGSGKFRLEGLAPGRYTAYVRLAGYQVLVVRDVVVDGGQVNRDPRLDGVTVGNDLLDTIVTVRRPDGTLVKGARVELRVPKNSGERGPRLSQKTKKDGVASFILPRGARRDVKVTMKNFLPYDKGDCVFPLDVTLDPGTELTVQLDIAGGALPPDPEISAWQVTLTPAKKNGAAAAPTASSSSALELPVILDSPAIHYEMVKRGRSSGSRTANLDKDRRQAIFKAVPPGDWEVTIRPRVTRKTTQRSGPQGKVRVRRSTKTGKRHKLGPVQTESGIWQKSVRFTVEASVLASLLPE